MENELTLSSLLLIHYTSQKHLQPWLLRILFSQLRGAQHLAKWSSVNGSASVPAGEHVPSTLTEAQVLSVYIIYHYTQEISWSESTWRIEVPHWDQSFLFVSLGGWHICAETDTGRRIARDSRMQKGRKQLFPCFRHSAQHRFPARWTFIPTITWFLVSFGLSFFEDFFVHLFQVLCCTLG